MSAAIVRVASSLFAVVLAVASAVGATARYSVADAAADDGTPLVVLRDALNGTEAAVAPDQGGELSSLRVPFRGHDVELLYRGRSYRPLEGFRGKASVLWPAVGSSIPRDAMPVNGRIESAYDFQGRRYPMPQHGFARTKAWRRLRSWANDQEAAVEVVLTDDAETRTQYPFGFELHITYRLHDGRVEMRHLVQAKATNTAPMFFSIGNHIAFAVPLVPGTAAETVKLESPSRFEYVRGADTTPSGETRPLSFDPPVPLKLFHAVPPLSVGAYEGDPWFRVLDPAGLAVKISHHPESWPTVPPFVQFNLWGGAAEGYFCPEPFVGVHNSFNKRAGLIELAPGKTWSWIIRVEPERAP